jgi:hypothetical protein
MSARPGRVTFEELLAHFNELVTERDHLRRRPEHHDCEALRLLREMEWMFMDRGEPPSCPECGGLRPEPPSWMRRANCRIGHTDDCELARVLGKDAAG